MIQANELTKEDLQQELKLLDKLVFSKLYTDEVVENEVVVKESETIVYCFVAGGYFTKVFQGEAYNDIDVFFQNKEDCLKAKDLLLTHENSKVTFESDFVINIYIGKNKVQLICKYFYSSPQECIDNFDFTICKFAYDGKNVVYNKRFFKDLAKKRIVIDNLLVKPLNSIKRAFKYVSRGYNLCPIGMARLVRECNELQIDWNNPDENIIEFYPDGSTTFLGLD